MKTIEEYIKENKNKELENISNGGSPAFLVDKNLILVKYSSPNEYGLARESAEKVMEAVNSKNAKGIRTPRHYAIHRVESGENNYCLVLQEKAKGINLDEYAYYKNNIKKQYELMNEFISMPESHIDKAIADICKLFHMGIELKAKNIFYDNSLIDGGFTFIDFIFGDEKEINFESTEDINLLTKVLGFLKTPSLPSWSKDYTDEEKSYSEQFCLIMNTRTFKSLERVIPNFLKYKRSILRTYDKKKLDNLRNNGFEFDDLNLTEEEMFAFEEKCKNIVKEAIKKYLNKSNKLWDIHANVLRLNLESNFMFSNWLYNDINVLKNDDFEDNYNYERECQCMLEDTLKIMFDSAIEINDYELHEVNFSACYKRVCESKGENPKKM